MLLETVDLRTAAFSLQVRQEAVKKKQIHISWSHMCSRCAFLLGLQRRISVSSVGCISINHSGDFGKLQTAYKLNKCEV